MLFYTKIYAVVIIGMLNGMNNFPTDELMIATSCLFLLQVLVVAAANERFFADLTINYALCGSKVLFCVG